MSISLTPQLFFQAAALSELYQKEVSAAKSAQSEGGETVTVREKVAILLAVGAPLVKRFVIPELPDETIDEIVEAVTDGRRRLNHLFALRRRAAAILDAVEEKAGASAGAILDVLDR